MPIVRLRLRQLIGLEDVDVAVEAVLSLFFEPFDLRHHLIHDSLVVDDAQGVAIVA